MTRCSRAVRHALVAVLVLIAIAVSHGAEPDRPSQPTPKLGFGKILPGGDLEIGVLEDRFVPLTYTSPVSSATDNVAQTRVRIAPGKFWVRQNGNLLDAETAAKALNEARPIVLAELGQGQKFDPFYLQFFKPETILIGISGGAVKAGPGASPPPTSVITPGLVTGAPETAVPTSPPTMPCPALRPASVPPFSYKPSSSEASRSRPTVEVERIEETRSSIEFTRRLEVLLKVSAAGKDAAGFRCRAMKAVDDTGTELVPQDRVLGLPDGFETFGCTLRLNPSGRKASTLQELSGVVEMLLPDRDPNATVKVTGFVGRPRVAVSHPAIAEAGAQLTILTKAELDRMQQEAQKEAKNALGAEAIVGQVFDKMIGQMFAGFGAMGGMNENSVIIHASDPNGRIVKIEFFEESGRAIPAGSTFRSGDQYVYNFPQKLPETAMMRVVLATPKAVVAVPFTFKDVPLP